MTTAAIYARKSTEQTGVADEQKSVARQVAHARQYATLKGWTVDESAIFVDAGISGAEFAGRPGFVRLIECVEAEAAFSSARHVRGIASRPRGNRNACTTLEQLVQAGRQGVFYLEDRERTLDSPPTDRERERSREGP